MGEVILVFAVIAIMIGGFFVMKRLDAFLEENRKAIEKENQKKEIPLMFLDAENNEKPYRISNYSDKSTVTSESSFTMNPKLT